MLILLSPAKKQNFETPKLELDSTKPSAHADAAVLMESLVKLSRPQISTLMSVSDKIADLNFHRFKNFNPKSYNLQNAKQALFAFQGDAYRAMDPDSLKKTDINFLQKHLIILSGLYGYLRPLDLIQAYRLEMKTPLKNPRGKDLYAFWSDKISKMLQTKLKDHKNKVIINLASGEYFKAVSNHAQELNIINVAFKEKKGAQYKVVGINAKRARGMMTRFIAENKIDTPKGLLDFNESGYQYNAALSSDSDYVFVK